MALLEIPIVKPLAVDELVKPLADANTRVVSHVCVIVHVLLYTEGEGRHSGVESTVGGIWKCKNCS